MPALYTKTRIAPTPSGYLHLGNVLSFAITSALAQRHCAKVLLRIDDIDQARANPLYIQDVFDTLNFLEMPWDEGPRNVNDFEVNYSQLYRIGNYITALDEIAEKGFIFACTCSRKQIDACNCANKNIPLDTPDVSWRLLTDASEITVNSYNRGLTKTTLPPDMQNFIVCKKDGYPAYQLTSVIDDLLFGVNLVVRGDDLWASTLAQYNVAAALGKGAEFGAITFYHHALIMDASGQKLSKSAGATSVKHLRENGKSAADVYGFISGILGIAAATTWQQLGEAIIGLNAK